MKSNSSLGNATDRVIEAANNLDLDVKVKNMIETTRTAEEAASACGVTVAQIVKSLIFCRKSERTPLLLLVSGANRVGESRVSERIGEQIFRPDARYVREMTGFAIGGIPPFGHASKIETYIDKDLLQFEIVWAAAGTPNAVMSLDPRALKHAIACPAIDMT